MGNLASLLSATRALVDRVCSNLDGDLDREQIELYELAFTVAELSAAQEAFAVVPGASADDRALLTDLAEVFAAEAIANALQRL